MRRLGVLTLLLFAGAAQAQPLAPPSGAAACSGCHASGPAAAAAMPPLQGLSAEEITAAMRAFRTGERPATVMDRIAKGFSEEETQAIAAWLSRGRP